VSAAVPLMDVICISVQNFVVAVMPLHGDFNRDRNILAVYRLDSVERLRVHRGAVSLLIQILHESADTVFALQISFPARALIDQDDVSARVQERQFAESVEQRVVVEMQHIFEDLAVRKELDQRAGLMIGGRADILHRGNRHFLP